MAMLQLSILRQLGYVHFFQEDIQSDMCSWFVVWLNREALQIVWKPCELPYIGHHGILMSYS
jgi:hypothetical protein